MRARGRRQPEGEGGVYADHAKGKLTVGLDPEDHGRVIDHLGDNVSPGRDGVEAETPGQATTGSK